MNRDCHGDVFDRWGSTWGRCFMDSTIFEIKGDIATCPNCERPWSGVRDRGDWDMDADCEVLRRDRTALESELASLKGEYSMALAEVDAAKSINTQMDGELARVTDERDVAVNNVESLMGLLQEARGELAALRAPAPATERELTLEDIQECIRAGVRAYCGEEANAVSLTQGSEAWCSTVVVLLGSATPEARAEMGWSERHHAAADAILACAATLRRTPAGGR